MKKICVIMLCFMMLISINSCKENDLEKVKVAEVAHSVFYAPQYVALELGYFEEVGLDVELINANGADKVTASLLSGDVEIGLQGPEPTIYLYKNQSSDYLVNFAQLTRTDGSFIFGREPVDNFDLSMLKGKSILGGRAGGVPEMTLEYVLKQAGLTIAKNSFEADVNVRTDVAFAAMAGAFLNGEGDYTTLFEPTASEMQASGEIYLLASVGEYAGEVAYTAYSCLNSYFNKNQETLKKFTTAIYKGQQYVDTHSDEEVAKVIHKQFTDVSIETLTSVVNRYRSINAWCKTPEFTKTAFDNLQKIMIEAKELDEFVDFDILVNNKVAFEVINN
ncbi:MAG: ABC transporter substrate-binding protein [Bacilli bacterium]|nr:ABC transporter substrate-binding protein [Bacilli bacterium]